ncbi:MAG: histidinol-phosphatase [Clostridia bacterium]|nr:histidinol-phosphatase [Clostridia bacterium]
MLVSDMHMHGDYSDGAGRLSDFADGAIEKGLMSVGFSDHAPVPVENTWSMKRSLLDEYINEANEIKTSGAYGIDIFTGLELDYIEDIDVRGYIGFEGLPLDFFLGSVHYVYSRRLGKHMEVDGTPDEFLFLVEEGFEGDAGKVFRTYYNNVRRMIRKYRPKIAAHLDLVSKNNVNFRFFDESGKEYMAEVEKTLDAIKENGVIVEINAGGMSRGYMKNPYPSGKILERCRDKGIRIALNSDAHRPADIAYGFCDIIKQIRLMGFREIMVFKNGEWTAFKL